MVRNTVRRAATLVAAGTLAVLAAAGPALADSAPAPGPGVPGVTLVQTAPVTPVVPPCYQHHGLLSTLLDAAGTVLSDLLGVLL